MPFVPNNGIYCQSQLLVVCEDQMQVITGNLPETKVDHGGLTSPFGSRYKRGITTLFNLRRSKYRLKSRAGPIDDFRHSAFEEWRHA